MRMKKKNSYYSEKQIQKLEEIAEATGITVAEHLRRAVDLYIKTFIPNNPGEVDEHRRDQDSGGSFYTTL